MEKIGLIGIGTSKKVNSLEAAREITQMATDDLEDPAAVSCILVFCGGRHDPDIFLREWQASFVNAKIIGGSTPGIIAVEFISYSGYECGAVFFSGPAPDCKVFAFDQIDGEKTAGNKLGQQLRIFADTGDTVLLFYDAVKSRVPLLPNSGSSLLEGIYEGLAGKDIHIVGAGMIADFYLSRRSYVFSGDVVGVNQVAAVKLPFGVHIATMHGCIPISGIMEITRAQGPILYELNGYPALEIIGDLLRQQPEELVDTLPLTVMIGGKRGNVFSTYNEQNYINRVIIDVTLEDSSITLLEGDLKVGAKVQLMLRNNSLVRESTRRQIAETLEVLPEQQCLLALYIDCAGRSSVMSGAEIEEASIFLEKLGPNIPRLGFYSGAEIAPIGNCSYIQNWAGVLVVFTREKVVRKTPGIMQQNRESEDLTSGNGKLDYYTDLCNNLGGWIMDMQLELNRAVTEARRSSSTALLIDEAHRSINFKTPEEIIFDRFARVIIDTLLVDFTAILQYYPDERCFYVCHSTGEMHKGKNKIVFAELPGSFYYVNSKTLPSPMLRTIQKTIRMPFFLWAFNREYGFALLIGNTQEDRNVHLPFVEEDRQIVEMTLKVLIDLLEQRRAQKGLELYKNSLELMVEEKTAELLALNQRLRLENRRKKRAEKEMRKALKNMEFLSRTAMEFVRCSAKEADLYKLIGEELHNLVTDAIVIIAPFDDTINSFWVHTILGLPKGADSNMNDYIKILRYPLLGTAKKTSIFAGGRLRSISGGVYSLAGGQIPKAVCIGIENSLLINDIFVQGFQWQDRLYGCAVIITYAGKALADKTVVETFINQASIALQRKQAEETIWKQAHYDLLCDIPNRIFLNHKLDVLIAEARQNDQSMALLLLDLDNFKKINDSLGHDAGDLVLTEVAKRIKECLRENDFVARLGGDEFVIILPRTKDKRRAAVVAEKLLACLINLPAVGGIKFDITASIGISIFPEDAQDRETLLQKTDIAMYQAKKKGRNNYHFTSDGLR